MEILFPFLCVDGEEDEMEAREAGTPGKNLLTGETFL